jgi:type III pantothenate kinase
MARQCAASARHCCNAPMLLVVDVGNTQTHFGVFPTGATEISEHWRFATVRESTLDELGAALSNLLGLRGLGFADIDASIVSSTVPQLSEQWTEMASRYLEHTMLVVGPSIRTGMPIRMDNPREVGADRLVNAVAAYARIQDACVVVDFGTAITYDVVSAAGEYLGGIITPGAEISIDALYERAAKLPKVELAVPRSLIGKSTVDAIRSGIVFGFAAQVDGIVSRLRDELGAETKVLATGGLAGLLVPAVRETIDEVDDLLTLTGLRLIWERNTREDRLPGS